MKSSGAKKEPGGMNEENTGRGNFAIVYKSMVKDLLLGALSGVEVKTYLTLGVFSKMETDDRKGPRTTYVSIGTIGQLLLSADATVSKSLRVLEEDAGLIESFFDRKRRHRVYRILTPEQIDRVKLGKFVDKRFRDKQEYRAKLGKSAKEACEKGTTNLRQWRGSVRPSSPSGSARTGESDSARRGRSENPEPSSKGADKNPDLPSGRRSPGRNFKKGGVKGEGGGGGRGETSASEGLSVLEGGKAAATAAGSGGDAGGTSKGGKNLEAIPDRTLLELSKVYGREELAKQLVFDDYPKDEVRARLDELMRGSEIT